MKKLLLAFFIIVPTIAFSQEIYLRCIGDNVNVRKGPGTKYAVEQLHGGVHCGFGKAQLFRGEILIWDGKQQNGFYHVTQAYEVCWENDYGWVSKQFLTKAEKCTACKGRGNTGRKCPECNGMGVYACCHYTGMELCENCYGIGYW